MKTFVLAVLLAFALTVSCQLDERGCEKCPEGQEHYYNLGLIKPTNGDPCQCVRMVTPSKTTQKPANYAACSRPTVKVSDLYSSCVDSCGNSELYPGSKLQCLNNICSYPGKVGRQPCQNNDECASNLCFEKTCAQGWVGGACGHDGHCLPNVYCDQTTNKCIDTANYEEPCGAVTSNTTLIRCKSGFTCVSQNSTTIGICINNADIGQSCSNSDGIVHMKAPQCADPSNKCINGICKAATFGSKGAKCDESTQCILSLSCFKGTCQDPKEIKCSNNTECGYGKYCNCEGVCAADLLNPYVTGQCTDRLNAVNTCVRLNCPARPAFYPYDGFSCGATICKGEIDALFCCHAKVLGTDFVAPKAFDPNSCKGALISTTTASPSESQQFATTLQPTNFASTLFVSVSLGLLAVASLALWL